MNKSSSGTATSIITFTLLILMFVSITWFRWTIFKRAHPHAGLIEYIFHD